MLKNYFNVALRSLLKHRVYAFINILGLSIGIAAFLLILQYVDFELSYEDFIENKQNVYRVQLDVFRDGELMYQSAENYPGAGPAMLSDLPEVIRSAKLYNIGAKNNIVVTREDTSEPIVFKHKKLLYTEGDFLPLFSYEMVYGDAATALSEPFKMAISETTAKKYFGNENPIGKFLRLEDDDFNNELCEITGVFRDSPENTHLKADILISFTTLFTRGDIPDQRYKSGWARKDFYTYVELAQGTDLKEIQAKLPALVDKYKPENSERNQRDVLLLQPISDIHLYSRLTDEPEVHGNGDGVYYLALVAAFILIMAWVNYVNLSTARSLDRSKEVGLRKVMGSYRSNLVAQFLVESFVINLVALMLAALLILIFTPSFRQLGGTPESYIIWFQGWFWLAVVGILFVGSLFSGLYPAFVLSSFKPAAVLHGNLGSSSRGLLLRKGLVIFQFSTSVIMIIGTAVVYDQMNYMQTQDLGLKIDQTIVVERPSKRDTSFTMVMNAVDRFQNSVSSYPGVEYVAKSTMLPGKKLRFRTPLRRNNQTANESVIFATAFVDYDFMKAMDLQIVAGRGFEREFRDDVDSVALLTENGARSLGYKDPAEAIGQVVTIDQFRLNLRVIGIVEDFHQENLKEEILPVIFGTARFMMDYNLIKVSTSDLASILNVIEEKWHENFPGNPFEYFFLDQYFNSYYEADRQFRDLFATFSVLAMIIGCLGLFGLSSFTALQKTREVAIRKVLGSSVLNIIQLLSKESLILVGLAILIAWPLVYLAMNSWLESYPYRTDINLWFFFSSGLMVALIALVTIGFHTLRSATANPVDSLNYE